MKTYALQTLVLVLTLACNSPSHQKDETQSTDPTEQATNTVKQNEVQPEKQPSPTSTVDTTEVLNEWMQAWKKWDTTKDNLHQIRIEIAAYESNDIYTWWFNDQNVLIYGEHLSESEGYNGSDVYFFENEEQNLVAISQGNDDAEQTRITYKVNNNTVWEFDFTPSSMKVDNEIESKTIGVFKQQQAYIHSIFNQHMDIAKNCGEDGTYTENKSDESEESQEDIPDTNAVSISCYVDEALTGFLNNSND